MMAPTVTRVESHSSPCINERNREKIRARIAQYEGANRHELTYRLAELDQEWDIVRVLECNFTSVVLGGLALGTLSNRKWFLLSAVGACFMAQHVIEGWCPPLAVLRRLGFRTADEINHERMALKILRGDFAELGVGGIQGSSAASLLDALSE